MSKPSRNDRCPCGSGRKYKRCCALDDPRVVAHIAVDAGWQRLREYEVLWRDRLLAFAAEHYGPSSLEVAWEDFNLGHDEPFAEDSPELEALFFPWFLFSWLPSQEKAVDLTKPGDDPLFSLYPVLVANTPFSFFQVVSLDPERGRVVLRDLLLGVECEVKDRRGSLTFHLGAILFARAVTFRDLDSTTLLLGCSSLVIPINYLPDILDLRKKVQGRRKQVQGRRKQLTPEILCAQDARIRGTYLEIREQLMHPAPRVLTNTEGHLLIFMSVRFELKGSLEEAAERLRTLNGYPLEDLLSDAVRGATGEIVELEFPWLKLNGGRPDEMAGNTVLGRLKLSPGHLEVQVNSKEREQKIRQELESRLGDRVRFKHSLIQSPESMMKEAPARDPSVVESEQSARLENPEVRARLQAMAKRHWESWIDEALPALEGKSPRVAAQGGRGRELLEALLLDFEGKCEERQGEAGLMAPDVPELRRRLGL